MKIQTITGIALLSIVALLFGACTPIPTPAPPPSSTMSGTIEVYVTDAPPREQVTSIMVTVSEVQVHITQAEREEEQNQEQSDSDNQTKEQEKEQEQQQAQQGEGKWTTIDLSDNATTFDLLKIKGIEQYLGANEVTAGKYTQVRLVVDTIQVSLGDGELQDATVPSKELKIVRPFNVVAGETTALILDFEADKMVTVTGAGKIMVKPVVKLSTKQKGPSGKPEEAKEKKTEELEFKGTIESIDDTTWTMAIDGEIRTVDVSNADIDGKPEVGLKAEVEGTVVDDTIVASEVEIKVAEEEEVKVSLEDTLWELESYGNPGNLTDIIEDTEITIEFISAEGKLRGSAGCNSYFGGYTISDGKITIDSPVGSTMKACPEPIMNQEVEYLAILQNVESYQIDDDKLEIISGDKVLVFELD